MEKCMRRTFVFITGVILVGLISFQSLLALAAEKPLVVAIDKDFATLDATLIRIRPDMIADMLIYDALFYRNPETFKPEPNLVKQLKQVDPTTWDIDLRQGVIFHDGSEMTAEDVVFSMERILDPEVKAPYRGSFSWIKSVSASGRYAIRLTTHRPFGLISQMLTFMYILPKRHLEKVGPETFAIQPVGSGPYKVVKWERGNKLVLTANENWWKGAPPIKDVVIRVIPETSTRIAELLTGGVHIAWRVPADQIGLIKDSKVAHISAQPILRVDFLVLDGDGRGGKTPLADVRVRRAIQHAINVEEIISHVLKGYGERVNAGLNRLHFGCNPSIPPVRYDPDKAKQLLREAGYPADYKLRFNTYNTVPDTVSEAVRVYLEAVGIRVDRKHFADTSAFVRTRNSGQLNGMFELSWGSQSVFDADQIFWPLLRSDEKFTYNTSPQIDAWLEEARYSINQENRAKLYSQVQRYILENAWWVPMYARYSILGVSNKVSYKASGDELIRIFDAKWIE
ncbi:MAG: ABC transporter substrate-binding protein [Candidatus Hodarchaeota archaeon]